MAGPPRQLSQQVDGTVAANGTVSFTFPTPTRAVGWVATISVPNANSGATFQAFIGGSPIGTWQGPNVGGPFPINDGEQVTVQGTSCISGVQLQCILQGQQFEGNPPGVTPVPQTVAVSTISPQVLIGSGVIPAGSTSTNVTLAIDPGIQTVFVVLTTTGVGATSATIVVTGTVTGIQYLNPAGAQVSSGAPYDSQSSSLIWSVIENTGNGLRLQISGLSGAAPVSWYLIGERSSYLSQPAQNPGLPINVVDYGGRLCVTKPITGAGTANALPTPATGFGYRLHALCWDASGQFTFLLGHTSLHNLGLYGNTAGAPAAGVPALFRQDFYGQIMPEGVDLIGSAGTGCNYFLYYDNIVLPTIQ